MLPSVSGMNSGFSPAKDSWYQVTHTGRFGEYRSGPRISMAGAATFQTFPTSGCGRPPPRGCGRFGPGIAHALFTNIGSAYSALPAAATPPT